jgi:putative transposase
LRQNLFRDNIHNRLLNVSYKDRKAVTADLKIIYTADTESAAEQALMAFAQTWDKQYPTISKSWLNHWPQVILPQRHPQSRLHHQCN